MSDQELLERTASRFDPPDDAFERFTRLRDKRQRNKRIAAGVVAVVVVAGVAVGMSRALGHGASTRRPAGPPTVISPSVKVPGMPDVDYVLDLNTSVRTPLPDAFTRSRPYQGTFSPAGYALSPDGSLLAYLRDAEDGSNQIFVGRTDGTGVRQVTHSRIGPGEPAWSPDGTRIAYAARFSPGSLFVVDVASGEATRVTDDDLVEGPQFTPDGSSILYTGGSDSRPMIMTVPVTGGKSTPLFALGADLAGAENLSLSPNGSLITFLEQGRPEGERRWVANTDGTRRRLMPDACLVLRPAGAWSPNGSRIVCSDRSAIVVVDIATGDVTHVAEGGPVGEAIWLDDDTLLVDV